MFANQFYCNFYFDELHTNRKILFSTALKNAKNGKVLYILPYELEELPQLSQEMNSTDRHYMKMISFLYAKTPLALLQSLSTLPDWQSVPSTIILDDLSSYCNKNNLHTACGVVSFLIDSARSCSALLKEPCRIYISATKGIVDEDYCDTLSELYFGY